MDFIGAGGYFRFARSGWAEVRELAMEFGWHPMGTRPGRNAIRRIRYALRGEGKAPTQIERAIARYREAYHGDYTVNEGQAVIARDSRNLADALQLALHAIGDLFTETGERTRMRCDFTEPVLKMLRGFCDDESRTMLRQFIRFCRAGAFEIY
ncbi:MAG TPA: hypothetical protein VN541_12905 [Tepidisphaeraceae bacterium]|nr:hypothetical protein [Tepidisphaeraceae bacterium]